MKKATVALALLAGVFLMTTTPAQAQESEDDAIRAAVGHYLQGHATGDGSHHEKVFHPDSKLFWIRNGELYQRAGADYIAGAPGKPAEDEDQRQRRITLVDVTGTAAVVKVELDYPSALITDYFSMLKVDSTWQIVNKIFYVAPKSDS